MNVTVQQVRWFRNGDHPHDRVGELLHDPMTGQAYPRKEGAVVRYFRDPDVPGDSICVCGSVMADHGWIDVDPDGHPVCPGDLVVTEVGPAGREVCWPDGSVMARSCTCQIREHVIMANVLCPHHGVHKQERERRAVELAHRMRAAFHEEGSEEHEVVAHKAAVPAEIMESWDAELDALDLSGPY